MVAKLKLVIHLHDNNRIIQREKTTCSLDKFTDTFSDFKQHVSKFVGISDVATELYFPHYDTTFAKVVKKPQSTSETFTIRTNDQYVSTKDYFTNEDTMLLINIIRKTTSWKAGSVKITTNTETEKRGTMTNNGRDNMKNRASNGTLNDTSPRILKKTGDDKSLKQHNSQTTHGIVLKFELDLYFIVLNN